MYEKAIIELLKATSVEHWNDIRSTFINKLTGRELCKIDSSGLIVEILGADPIPQPWHQRIDDSDISSPEKQKQ